MVTHGYDGGPERLETSIVFAAAAFLVGSSWGTRSAKFNVAVCTFISFCSEPGVESITQHNLAHWNLRHRATISVIYRSHSHCSSFSFYTSLNFSHASKVLLNHYCFIHREPDPDLPCRSSFPSLTLSLLLNLVVLKWIKKSPGVGRLVHFAHRSRPGQAWSFAAQGSPTIHSLLWL